MTGEVHAVILNWRDAESTRHCLDSLLDEDVIEVIWLVDNESTGALRSFARAPRVRLIELAENRGFAAGVNEGLARAIESSANYVLVINNDATLAVGSSTPLVRALQEDSGLGGVAPVIVDVKRSLREYGTSLSPTCKVKQLSRPGLDVDYLTWACLLLRAAALKDVGLLDERYFMYWEDVEFGMRLKRGGWRVTVDQGSVVYHEVSKSHTAAGGAIAMYSVAGLVTFARSQRGLLRLGLARALGRLARAVLKVDAEEARWTWLGIRLGWSAIAPIFPKANAWREGRLRAARKMMDSPSETQL